MNNLIFESCEVKSCDSRRDRFEYKLRRLLILPFLSRKGLVERDC